MKLLQNTVFKGSEGEVSIFVFLRVTLPVRDTGPLGHWDGSKHLGPGKGKVNLEDAGSDYVQR